MKTFNIVFSIIATVFFFGAFFIEDGEHGMGIGIFLYLFLFVVNKFEFIWNGKPIKLFKK